MEFRLKYVWAGCVADFFEFYRESQRSVNQHHSFIYVSFFVLCFISFFFLSKNLSDDMHSVPLGFSIKAGSNATRTNANSFFVDRNHSWFFDEEQYKSSLKYANHVQITTPRTTRLSTKMVVFIILEHFLMFNGLNGFWSLWCMLKQFPAITERLISMKSFLFTLDLGLKVVAIFLKCIVTENWFANKWTTLCTTLYSTWVEILLLVHEHHDSRHPSESFPRICIKIIYAWPMKIQTKR